MSGITTHSFFSFSQSSYKLDVYVLPILQRKMKEARKVFKGIQLVSGWTENPTQARPHWPGHTDSKPGLHSAVSSSGLPHSYSLSYLQKSWALNAASRGQSRKMRDSKGRMQGRAWAPIEFRRDPEEISTLLSEVQSAQVRSSGGSFKSLKGTQARREETSLPLNVHNPLHLHHSFLPYHL